MSDRSFERLTPAGRPVHFTRMGVTNANPLPQDVEDHAFHVETDGRHQVVHIRIDALAVRHVDARIQVTGDEIAIRHVLHCIDAGLLPREGSPQATEVVTDIRPLLG